MGGAREESHTFLKGTFLVKPLDICVPIVSKKSYQTHSVKCLKVFYIVWVLNNCNRVFSFSLKIVRDPLRVFKSTKMYTVFCRQPFIEVE